MKPVLVLDNYDSFTYNLVHYVESFGRDVEVFRNDKIALADVDRYDEIILSPGPGLPKNAGILHDVIRTYGATKKILGVCLGHQAIAEVYGGAIYNLDEVYHGVATPISVLEQSGLFEGLKDELLVGRYHSWTVTEGLPDCFVVTARDKADNSIMALRHKEHNVSGVQFHPESVLTEGGLKMIENWLQQ